MPIYEYECPKGHVTTRVASLKQEPPKTVTCPKPCERRAKKRTVYRVGVGGDLPTRGAF